MGDAVMEASRRLWIDVVYHMSVKSQYLFRPKSNIRTLGFFSNKSRYIFPRIWDVEFKPKYRMEC